MYHIPSIKSSHATFKFSIGFTFLNEFNFKSVSDSSYKHCKWNYLSIGTTFSEYLKIQFKSYFLIGLNLFIRFSQPYI